MGTNMKMKTLSGKDANGNIVTFELESQGYMRVSNGHIQFSPNNETWVNVIAVSDLKGGHGDPGKSAYEYAKEGGYTGTEEEFAEQLANGGEGGAGAVELTQAEYDNLSEEDKMKDVIYFVTDSDVVNDEVEYHNAGSHNAKYRGKFLGNTVTSEQYARISDGTFKGMYIGDYWTIGSVNYRIAAFDYYMNCGVTPTTEHHVTLVPDTPLYTHCMNSGSDTTSGGYLGSEMYKTGLNQAKTIINTAFGETHVLKYGNRLPTSSPESSSSDVESTVELMNQINVYGSIINGSNTGSVFTYDNVQYPLFALNHSMITNGVKWWLRDGSDQHGFICTSIEGITNINGSRQVLGVRPSFNIKG